MEERDISGHRTHPGREDLAGEHVWGDAGQLLLLVIFLAVWISDTFFLDYSYIPDILGTARTPLGIIVLVISGYLAWSSLRIVFGEVRATPEVIRKGMFARMRHPIYLGAILLYLGLLLLRISLAATGVWLVIMAFYHFLARYEEQLLLKKFGQDYADYMRDVPMWIPRILPK